MKKFTGLYFTLLIVSIQSLAQTTTEWPASNPPFQEHPLQALWTESFELDSAIVSRDTTRKALIKTPNDLSTIDKAVASYVSFTTQEWGESLYQSDYFKSIDYPTSQIVEQMNSEDHKNNGYYKHYFTPCWRSPFSTNPRLNSPAQKRDRVCCAFSGQQPSVVWC